MKRPISPTTSKLSTTCDGFAFDEAFKCLPNSATVPAVIERCALTICPIHLATFVSDASPFGAFSTYETRFGTTCEAICISAWTSAAKKSSKFSKGAPASNGLCEMPYALGSTSSSTSANVVFGARSRRSPRITSEEPHREISAEVIYDFNVGISF